MIPHVRSPALAVILIVVVFSMAMTAHAGAGACCLPEGSCLDVPITTCDIVGGMFQGDGTECGSTTCVPFGACCFPDLSCAVLTEADCAAAGGAYQGDTTEVRAGLCPIVGACCFPDGGCGGLLAEGDCTAAGGVYQGFETACTAVVCTGACSFEDGSCRDGLDLDACTASGGNFLGGGSECATSDLPAIVQCATFSFDQNGMVTLVFDQFDDQGGARVLDSVRLTLEGEVVAAAVLTNLSGRTIFNTDLFVSQSVLLDLPSSGGGFVLVPIDILNLVISCGFSLPPGGSCDYGSPLRFIGAAEGETADPEDLAVFVGGGTVDASVVGVGDFEYGGSGSSLVINPHRVEGKLTLVYEYTVNDVECPGDADGNGVIDFQDLLNLLFEWGPCPDPCPGSCQSDLDGDCDVDFQDLLDLLFFWGPCAG